MAKTLAHIHKRALILAIATIAWYSDPAWSTDITVMNSGGFSAAYKTLKPSFEQTTGKQLITVWGPSMGTTPEAIPVRLEHGEAADVVIMVREALHGLVTSRQVVEGSCTDLARSKIAMAVKSGAKAPDISTVKAFRRALLSAKSVAYSDSASGTYIASKMFKKLGIAKQMAAKSSMIPAEPVGQVVARGDAEIGFQQLSELLPVSGITIVGPIPEEVQKVTVYSAGVVTTAKEPAAARVLLDYLSSPAAYEAIRKSGLEPIHEQSP